MTKNLIDGPYKVASTMPYKTISCEQPDYLSFVDDDIREMFVDKGAYLSSDVLSAQLIKELRALNKVLSTDWIGLIKQEG